MSDSERYQAQVSLLIRTLPHIASEGCFAIKGGTAINLFLRDFPRLSVDIDLTYLPIQPRDESLHEISEALSRIGKAITRVMPESRVFPVPLPKTPFTMRLVVHTTEAQIKIEPNLIIRGTAFPASEKELAPAAQELFQAFVIARICGLPDIYGGKICAALDRQHPRDFFDVKTNEHSLFRSSRANRNGICSVSNMSKTCRLSGGSYRTYNAWIVKSMPPLLASC